ncbi:MAG: secretion protein HlyD [Humidesulfovibrio sp.]|nr:secretion protein HlyD [Humidesulfovibrio sp.]
MNRKRILVVLAVAALCGLAWFIIQRNSHHGEELKLFGNVDIREVELSFRVPGKLAEVRVDEGDQAKAGELLAVLDAQHYRDARDKAAGDRDAAAANMAKYRAGNRAEEIAQARAQVAQIDAQVKNAATLAKRRELLFKSGAISAQEYDDAVASRDALQAQLQSVRKALQLQNAGFRTEDVQGVAASLRSADAAVAAATTDLNDTKIIAPADGTVISRVREPGAMAEAGATVLVLSLDKPVWVRAYVPEPLLGKVSQGMPVRVYTDSRPDRPYKGVVGFISPVAEFTPKNVETETLRTDLVYRIRIVVNEPDKELRQGMPVTVRAAPAGTTTAKGPGQ